MGRAFAHALRIRMRPASSTISASITPGLSLKSAILAWPRMTASVASMLHCGHSDRVFLGTPVIMCILSRLLSSRPGAQEGLGNSPSGRIALKCVERLHAKFDAARETRAWYWEHGSLTSGVGLLTSGGIIRLRYFTLAVNVAAEVRKFQRQ